MPVSGHGPGRVVPVAWGPPPAVPCRFLACPRVRGMRWCGDPCVGTPAHSFLTRISETSAARAIRDVFVPIVFWRTIRLAFGSSGFFMTRMRRPLTCLRRSSPATSPRALISILSGITAGLPPVWVRVYYLYNRKPGGYEVTYPLTIQSTNHDHTDPNTIPAQHQHYERPPPPHTGNLGRPTYRLQTGQSDRMPESTDWSRHQRI